MPVSSLVATSDLRFFAAAPGAAGMGPRSFPDLRCPARFDGSCAIAEIRQSGTDPVPQIVVSAFDPASGRARQLATAKPTNAAGLTCWDISPDGHTIAFSEFAWDAGNRITLVTAGSGESRTILVKDFLNIADLSWAADGRSLLATTATLRGAELVRVMLDGKAVLLQRLQGQGMFAPRSSPDGRSLLVGVQQNNSNAWVIER
jgi:Tol biopolymer transport system component